MDAYVGVRGVAEREVQAQARVGGADVRAHVRRGRQRAELHLPAPAARRARLRAHQRARHRRARASAWGLCKMLLKLLNFC